MQPLNRVPAGMLDFFGIKAGGWGPRELSQLLTPQLDLTDWYTQTNALDVSFTVTGSPFGNVGSSVIEIATTAPIDLCTGGALAVPQDEIWLVLEADLTWLINAQAGAVAQLALASGPLIVGPIVWHQMVTGFTTSDATINRRATSTLLYPWWALGGDVIRVQNMGILAGAASVGVTGHLRLVRMKR
jgi:hypothetical protein